MFLKLKIKSNDKNIQATDVGYVLHKNPFSDVVSFENKFGKSYLLWNKVSNEEVELSLLMDIDSLDLFKKANRGDLQQESLGDYVNNQAYISSVIFTQMISKVFSSCLSKKCEKLELIEKDWNIEIEIASLKGNRMSKDTIIKLFSDLNYEVELEQLEYNSNFDWGLSNNYNLTLKHTNITMFDLFSQLTVLIPVINPEKHFQVDHSTLQSFLNKTESWLKNHPMQDLIINRYLDNDKKLTELAKDSIDSTNTFIEVSEDALEKKESLGQKRYNKFIEILEKNNIQTFVDMGCGDGKLIRKALEHKVNDENYFSSIIGCDVATRTLSYVSRKIKNNNYTEVNLITSSLLYKDPRLLNQDALIFSEVIEHIEPEKHELVLNNIFHFYYPEMVVFSTPNKDYNVVYELGDKLRHKDHRFEWSKEEFQTWINNILENYPSYEVLEKGFIGEEEKDLGGSSQYVVFKKRKNISKDLAKNQMLVNHFPMTKGIDLSKILKDKKIPTRFGDVIEIKNKNNLEPLHNLSRFSIPFESLIYIPPTMSPVESGSHENYLEYPTDAFNYYKSKVGVNEVICETKHMGSRGLILVCKDNYTAKKLFNSKNIGVAWTRSGYRFFDNDTEKEVMETLHKALTEANIWERLNTTWILLDTEIMPWNFKGEYGLIVKQYADIGCSGKNTLHKSKTSIDNYVSTKDKPSDNILNLKKLYDERYSCIEKYIDSYSNYIWKINSFKDLKIAPFHILATSHKVYNEQNHIWHLETIKTIVEKDTSGILTNTDYYLVNLNNETEKANVCKIWEDKTNFGAEGMVIKPLNFMPKDINGNYVQPAIKCRGKEYLRIIYGAEYTLPNTFPRLRKRNVKRKRYLAINEFLLGLEGLSRFVDGNSLEDFHECIFGTLSLDSTTIDPRL